MMKLQNYWVVCLKTDFRLHFTIMEKINQKCFRESHTVRLQQRNKKKKKRHSHQLSRIQVSREEMKFISSSCKTTKKSGSESFAQLGTSQDNPQSPDSEGGIMLFTIAI
jgi:hypothetical protein